MAIPRNTAVLLLAHGSPDSVDEIPEFLLQVTGGRAVPEQVIEEVKHRYGLIGQSPLTCWTREQGDLLSRELRLPVYIGMRNWKPFIADAVRSMADAGTTRVIAICLAPQNSRTSVGLYRNVLNKEIESCARKDSCEVDFVEAWHDHPLLIKAFAEKLLSGWTVACREMKTRVPVIFSAHSVPQRTITDGDPYETQAKETGALVAREVLLEEHDWSFAFQSQGMSGGPWLGPTVEETILCLKAQGHQSVFVQPVGFLCDHVEVLYDIDIAFQQFAKAENIALYRAESLNGSSLLTAALADVVRSRLNDSQS
ncbi:MAG: ferrochelatase [Acidobacteriaceae bacterium]|nr:ferrochelatase [Acidobacteriaceae bacterium]